MSERVQIQITATEGASRVFQQVASGAERLDRSLDQVGDGFDELGRDSAASTRSLKEFENIGRDIGISIGILATGMSLAGQSFRDQEVALRTLERGYGDMADEMEAFANQIQDTTNFSNDAAIAAANTFRTLSDNYGFTADQIQQLISISADLAATMGISLSDAAFRVQSAMRGEAEAAEFLGLTLNDRALGLDKVSESMTEAERAQIRFNALQEQSAFALGTAAEQADTTYGAMTQLRDSVQDAGQAFGEFLGPLGEIGAFAADNAIQIAALGLALGQLGKTAAGLNEVSKAFTGLNAARLGLTGLTALMTGPAGIVVAAGLAGVAINKFAGDLGPTFQQATDGAVESVDALIEKIVELGDTSALANTVLGLDTITLEFQKINDDANQVIGAIGALIAEAAQMDDANAQTVEGLLMSSRAFDDLSVSVRNNIDANGDGIATLEELTNAQAFYNDEATRTKEVLDGLNSGADELAQIFAMTGEGAAFAKGEANAYTEALLAGDITGADYERMLQNLVTGYGNTQEAALADASATNEVTAAMEAGTTAVQQYLDSLNDVSDSGRTFPSVGAGIVATIDDLTTETAALNTTQQQAIQLNAAIQAGQREYADSTDDANNALTDLLATSLDILGVNGEVRASFDSVGPSVLEAAEAYRAMRESMVDIATSAPDAVEVLDTVFQSVVGNTDAWAKSSDAIAKWATELGGAVEHFDEWGNSIGWWSRMDEVVEGWGSTLDAATLSVQEHTAAQQAFQTIAEENAEIQQNVAVIQAKQAPLLADQIELTENYTQSIAEMGAEQATVALGFMDATQAGRALELQTLAISAASGELGAGGQEFATDIIVGAAQADAQLRMMLESMGLISVGADGTITVNFQDNATGPLEQLQQTMEQLAYTELLIYANGDASAANEMFEDIFGKAADWDDTEVTATMLGDNSDALARTSEAQSAVDTFGRSSGTATINVNDNASGVISGAINLLGSFAGRSETATITTYVNTVYQTFGEPGTRVALGGVVGNYAAGGVVAEMAEWGPELLHFPNGGVALARNRGIYTVPQGTYVDTAPATAYKLGSNIGVTVNINGPSSWDDAAAQVSRKIVPAIARAIREHERSLGAY